MRELAADRAREGRARAHAPADRRRRSASRPSWCARSRRAARRPTWSCTPIMRANLSAAARAACARLVDAGVPMLSQTVLLRGVNDDAATLEALLRTLVECRIKPYYLHHADLAPGTAHFRTSHRATGRTLMRALRGQPFRHRAADLCARHSRRRRQGAGGAVLPAGDGYGLSGRRSERRDARLSARLGNGVSISLSTRPNIAPCQAIKAGQCRRVRSGIS